MIGQFVVMQERSNGNERVGDMWIDTRVFAPTATLADVWEWAFPSGVHGTGRTMIRPDEGSMKQESPF